MKRLFVVLREDLGPVYKFVQGGHAVAQYALDFPGLFKEWGNSFIEYVQVENARDLQLLSSMLKGKHIQFASFFEDDVKQVTAISAYSDDELLYSLGRAV